ncbi:MAG: flagellar basal body rod protein FlgC [Gammaproteobacteria bacterium]
MSLYSIFDIAGSAMNAQNIRLNTTASNLANADTVSSSQETTYRARQPVFAEMMKHFNDKTSGVQVLGIVESNEPLRAEYNPEHAMANKDGYIYRPNVNVIDEMANMISASRSYQTNVEVLNTAKQMMMRTLSIGQ